MEIDARELEQRRSSSATLGEVRSPIYTADEMESGGRELKRGATSNKENHMKLKGIEE
jgi:hypothetical protein